jgi:hypothetical protein
LFQSAEELNHLMSESLAFWNYILIDKKKDHPNESKQGVLTEHLWEHSTALTHEERTDKEAT